MRTSGSSVVVAHPFRAPASCASCLAPATTVVRLGGGTSASDVPYCADCGARARRASQAPLSYFLGMFGAMAVFTGALFVFPIPRAGVALPALAGLLVSAVLAHRALRPVTAPATARDRAVVLEPRIGGVFCTNAKWAEELAQINGGAIRPERRIERAWVVMFPMLALVVGLLGAMLSFGFLFPRLHVDHALPGPIQMWIDGRRDVVVEPNREATIDLRRGTHELGWSDVGAAAPRTSSTVFVGPTTVLYNPGASTCYLRNVEVYSTLGPLNPLVSAERAGNGDGPLPVVEVHEMGHVDHWFRPNDLIIDLGGSPWKVKVAIEREPVCTQLAARGCARPVLEELLRCERAAASKPDAERCVAIARRGCAGT